ncbi:MAG: rluD [Acidimicrobiales bacterium]|nr:rluD [Acidimicrobiales bacterium]
MTDLHEEVPAALDGQRIDRVVAMLTGISRTDATELVKVGGVRVDDAVATRGADRLHAGQQLSIAVPEAVPAVRPQPEAGIELPIVYVDDHVIVMDKPADLVVHPGAGHVHGTVVSALLDRFPEIASVGDPDRPGIVHRLDRGTSGLLMAARTTAAYEDLVAQLSNRTVERRYRALVWGHPESPRGVVDARIGRSPKHPTKMAVTANGKEARTRYEVVGAFTEPSPTSLVTCQLETGRTHQIRVHLSAIGHPVVGDDRYNGVRQSLPSPRPFLHAEHLGFEHPVTGEHLSFDADLPPDLVAVQARVS